MPKQPQLALAELVKKRIADLTETRPRADIVKEAGLDDRTLAAIETGRVHLPLDRAPRLADALDIDTRDFVLLALRQFLPEEVVELIETDPTVYLETRELRSSVIALQVQLTAANSGAKEVAEDALRIIRRSISIQERTSDAMRGLKEIDENYDCSWGAAGGSPDPPLL